MATVLARSADGTRIGYSRFGSGPPMLLVHGSTADRHRWDPVLPMLAEQHTVHVLDRRGRGLSATERHEYHIDREAEDILAVLHGIRDRAVVLGHSYGALCALQAALRTDRIERLVLYEPPAVVPGYEILSTDDFRELRSLAEDGDWDAVLGLFFREALGVPERLLDAMRRNPLWQSRIAAAPTLPRELEYASAFDISERLGGIRVPVRMLLGTESPDYLRQATNAIAARLPNVEVRSLEGQQHLAIDTDPRGFVTASLVRSNESARQSEMVWLPR